MCMTYLNYITRTNVLACIDSFVGKKKGETILGFKLNTVSKTRETNISYPKAVL